MSENPTGIDRASIICTIVLNSRTIAWQKCEALRRRARRSGFWTSVSLNFRLESTAEEEEASFVHVQRVGAEASGYEVRVWDARRILDRWRFIGVWGRGVPSAN